MRRPQDDLVIQEASWASCKTLHSARQVSRHKTSSDRFGEVRSSPWLQPVSNQFEIVWVLKDLYFFDSLFIYVHDSRISPSLLFQRARSLSITVATILRVPFTSLTLPSRSRRTPPSPPSGKRFWWRWLCPRRVSYSCASPDLRLTFAWPQDAREYVEKM